jgi:hypothetical protein
MGDTYRPPARATDGSVRPNVAAAEERPQSPALGAADRRLHIGHAVTVPWPAPASSIGWGRRLTPQNWTDRRSRLAAVSESSAKWVMVAAVVLVPTRERCSQGGGSWGSGRYAQDLLLVFAQVVHVEITLRFQPVLVHLDRERPD